MNKRIRMAIPSAAPGGLAAFCSDHFGHCDCFTLVSTDENGSIEVDVIPNRHGSGCGSVVSQLCDVGVDAIMVKGIGLRPLMGFRQAGIEVFQGPGALVGDVIEAYRTGKAVVVEERNSCQGGGEAHRSGNCGSHN